MFAHCLLIYLNSAWWGYVAYLGKIFCKINQPKPYLYCTFHRSIILLVWSCSFNYRFSFLTTLCHTEGKIFYFNLWNFRFETFTPKPQNVAQVKSICTDTSSTNNFMLVEVFSVNSFILMKGCPSFMVLLPLECHIKGLSMQKVKQVQLNLQVSQNIYFNFTGYFLSCH